MDKDFYSLCKKSAQRLQKGYKCSRSQIQTYYEKEFTILEGFFDFSINLGISLDRYIPQPQKPFLQFALLRIQEKALKISREGKILMENGSASGAIARWRTLFEFSVVAKILVKYPDLAPKYVDYAKIDDYKWARKLVLYKDKLNLCSYNLDFFPEIETAYNNTKEKYGWSGKDYEWAKNEDIKSPNLFNLAQAVGLEHLYAYVDEAHKYNHPCTRYLLNDRGSKASKDDLQTYLFSPFDMELPLQLIAISLCEVNHATMIGYAQLLSTDSHQLDCNLVLNDKFPATMIEMITERFRCKGSMDCDDV